ncbi:stage II sporulation protein M [Lactococcus garvieae]|uniref:Membrane protein with DUF95 n=2 Tax=Lactococcus TaxID=1357 RepID=U2XY23_9LACT|nr:stage II sporulation protein M [Lactococcus garvieae]ERL47809.1 Membrane protein with DUF95 [Lactococcus garvieae DCC43]
MSYKTSYIFAISLFVLTMMFGMIATIFLFKDMNLDVLYSKNLGWSSIFQKIFIKNISLIIFIILLGIVPYVPTILLASFNFFVFGISLMTSVKGGGDWFVQYLHSIVEIPAILIGISISFRISQRIYDKIMHKENVLKIKKLEILLIPLLLLIGATIESFYLSNGGV